MKLSKQSKELMLFLTKNKHLNYSKQTNKTNNILRELYNEILEANNYVKNQVKFRHMIKKILSATQITKPLNFNAKSFPEIVRNHIDETSISEISYTFSLFDRNIKLIFITDEDASDLNVAIYNNYVDNIIIWLYILNEYSSKQCSKTLIAYFYFTSLKKTLPDSCVSI